MTPSRGQCHGLSRLVTTTSGPALDNNPVLPEQRLRDVVTAAHHRPNLIADGAQLLLLACGAAGGVERRVRAGNHLALLIDDLTLGSDSQAGEGGVEPGRLMLAVDYICASARPTA